MTNTRSQRLVDCGSTYKCTPRRANGRGADEEGQFPV